MIEIERVDDKKKCEKCQHYMYGKVVFTRIGNVLVQSCNQDKCNFKEKVG